MGFRAKNNFHALSSDHFSEPNKSNIKRGATTVKIVFCTKNQGRGLEWGQGLVAHRRAPSIRQPPGTLGRSRFLPHSARFLPQTTTRIPLPSSTSSPCPVRPRGPDGWTNSTKSPRCLSRSTASWLLRARSSRRRWGRSCVRTAASRSCRRWPRPSLGSLTPWWKGECGGGGRAEVLPRDERGC